MAKGKRGRPRKGEEKNTGPKFEASMSVRFVGGPWNKKTMVVNNPPLERMVLASPEWCVYELLPPGGAPYVYQYAGEGEYAPLNEKAKARA